VLYRFDRNPVEGFVNPSSYLGRDWIELLTLGGNMQQALYAEIKAVCFASERSTNDLFMSRNLFERRPKVPGLWTRFTFRDGDQLDGVLSHNLPEWPEQGYFATPPYSGATRQRVFIPRAALSKTELLGVIGAANAVPTKATKRKKQEDAGQLKIFE
jgi:hypothetical protein